MIGEVRDATLGDAYAMAPLLRDQDRAEVMAAYGSDDMQRALMLCVEQSLVARVWVVDGQPACMFGITGSVFGQVGHPWFLSTALVEKNSRFFVRQCRRYLKEMLKLFPVLENYVDARYACSIRWLEWMGFKLDAPSPYGPLGVPFRRFELKAEN